MAHTRTCGGWRWCTVVHVSPEHVESGAGVVHVSPEHVEGGAGVL
jgi:hypothetical protein